MTTYFVSPVTGNDANSNVQAQNPATPWATLNKAVVAGSPVVGGDTVVLSPGTHRTTSITPTIFGSAGNRIKIAGDPIKQFSWGASVSPGVVYLSAYSTNDSTTPSARIFVFGTNALFWDFSNIIFMCGTNGTQNTFFSGSPTDFTMTDCDAICPASTQPFNVTPTAHVALNWTFERCFFVGGSHNIKPVTGNAGVDWDLNVIYDNCAFEVPTGDAVKVAPSGGLTTALPGGVRMYNCTGFCLPGNLLSLAGATANSTSIPSQVYGCLIHGVSGVTAGALGQLLEDWNLILASTPRANVTAGANSQGGSGGNAYALMLGFFNHRFTGRMPREHLIPAGGSPILGFASTSAPPWTQPTVDFFGRPRPAGGGSLNIAAGAYERHDTAALETSVFHSGSGSYKLVGPGDEDLWLLVDPSTTTISIWARYDTVANLPSAVLKAAPDLGINADVPLTWSDPGANAWAQLSASITPTASGVIALRITGPTASATAICYYDDPSWA